MGTTGRRVRLLVDSATTVVILLAAALVIYKNYPYKQPKATVPLPGTPVSLETAIKTGSADAKVALLVYTDFQCPYCKQFATGVIPQLRERYVDNGRLLLAFRHFPLEKMHPLAFRAAEAAACSDRQGRFLLFHDMLFAQKRPLSEEVIYDLAETIGLDLTSFGGCLADPARAIVERDLDSGRQLGITGTPALLFGTVTPQGSLAVRRITVGAMPLPDVERTINDLLAPDPHLGAYVAGAVIGSVIVVAWLAFRHRRTLRM